MSAADDRGVSAPAQLGPRCERKFRVGAAEADALLEWLRARLDPDPHASDPADPVQEVVSLYFDDATRSSYAGRTRSELPKHRLRRYDGTSALFLEEKLRVGERVWKRRVVAPEDGLEAIVHGTEPLAGELEWFRARFRTMGLVPTLLVRYERHAFDSPCGARVTVDRNVTAARVDERYAGLTARSEGRPALADVVVEVKGPLEPTERMREVLAKITVESTACSKYSHGLEAVGLEAPRNGDRA